MPMSDASEDALLREALAIIGDLDFDVNATADEDDFRSSLLKDHEPEHLVSLPMADHEPVVPALNEAAASSIRMLPTAQAEAVASSTHEAQEKVASLSGKWPGTVEGKPTTQNVSRIRRLEEIKYLRDLVGALEKRLSSIGPSSKENESISRTNGSNGLVAAWAQVATRQFERRHESEMENMRLKRLLQDQIQLGKSLERILLKKRSTIESFESDFAASKKIRRMNCWSWESNFEFKELLADCARKYGETNRVLAKFTDDLPVVNHRDIGLVHDRDLGWIVQTRERRILPFYYEDTAREIWNATPVDSPTQRTYDYQDRQEEEDSMTITVRATLDINQARSEFSGKVAKRRYIESSRTVIVVSGLLEPSEVANNKMRGVRMRYLAWIIVEPLESSTASKLTTYKVAVPEVDDHEDDQIRNVGTLTDFLVRGTAAELESRSQQLENRLFQHASNRGRVD